MGKLRRKRTWLYTFLIMGALMMFSPYFLTQPVVKQSTIQRKHENECLRQEMQNLFTSDQGFTDGEKMEEILMDCLGVPAYQRNIARTVTEKLQVTTEKNPELKVEQYDLEKKQDMCPLTSPLLKGRIPVLINPDLDYIVRVTNTSEQPLQNWPPTLEEVAVHYKDLELGGSYAGPRDCVCRTSVAVIVPIRNREMHLRYFLYYIHQLLQRQQLCYVVIVAEQVDDETFNKGQLMNSAFVYANRLMDFDCFIFHDVDLIAEDDRIPYTCISDHVYHLTPYIDKYDYKLYEQITVGGAVALTKHQFTAVNGYSNEFVGWGGEDNDMATRIKNMKFNVWRLNTTYNRFKMIKHEPDKGNPINPHRMDRGFVSRDRMVEDGLSSLNTLSVDVTKYMTHTRLKLKTFKPQYVEEVLNRPKINFIGNNNFVFKSFDLSGLAAKIAERAKIKEDANGWRLTK